MHRLAQAYVELTDYCRAPGFDQGIFQVKHDAYAKAYQRLNFAEQGEVTAAIASHYGELV
jgi:hypothetical protein